MSSNGNNTSATEKPCCACVTTSSPPVVSQIYWSLFGTFLAVGVGLVIIASILLSNKKTALGSVLLLLGILSVVFSFGLMAAAVSAQKMQIKIPMGSKSNDCVTCMCV